MPIDPTDKDTDNLNNLLQLSTEKDLQKSIAMQSEYEFYE